MNHHFIEDEICREDSCALRQHEACTLCNTTQISGNVCRVCAIVNAINRVEEELSLSTECTKRWFIKAPINVAVVRNINEEMFRMVAEGQVKPNSADVAII